MHHGIVNFTEGLLQPWKTETAGSYSGFPKHDLLRIRYNPALKRDVHHVTRRATGLFGHITLFGRVVMGSLAMLVTGVVLVVTVARTQAKPRTFEIPAGMFPDNIPYSFGSCTFFDYQSFNCRLNIDGEAVTEVYNGVFRTATYSSTSIRKLTLGDLVVAWGTPEGIAYYSQQSIVVWGARTAYFGVCAIKPESRVDDLGYGFRPQPTMPWHGFVSHISECPTER